MTAGPVQASVIVAALNAADHIEEQLLALARQQTAVSWELIVADNGSTDCTRAVVDRCTLAFGVPVRLVDASERRGVSAARNVGVAAAAGEFLLFTDADDVVDEHWVDEMVRALRDHPFVGGKLETLELNGSEVASWRLPLGEHDLPLIEGRPWVIGCNFGCTAAALAVIGRFDETVVVFSEDVAFSLAMHAHGMPAVFAERAVVHYRHRHDPRHAVRQMWGYGRSRELLYNRYQIQPPTLIDTLVRCYRDVRQVVRYILRRRRPMPPIMDFAFVVGEASVIWRIPGFWHPVTRIVCLENPFKVQRDRLGRLASVILRRG